eukprot:TRINITY_DN2727_c0_g1_i3.p4 TRINITY_DN2727_c0_g1~~TRINITY_DN2727_c0_g1_i3.p4  ORF type:complete len:134 (+),score=14.50 TRINITY_DN2727_c0_g1_i3:1072-1473(+)
MAAVAGDRMGDSQRCSGSGASAATSNLKFKATWMDDKDSEVCLLCDQVRTYVCMLTSSIPTCPACYQIHMYSHGEPLKSVTQMKLILQHEVQMQGGGRVIWRSVSRPSNGVSCVICHLSQSSCKSVKSAQHAC